MAINTQDIYRGIRSAIQSIDNPTPADREITDIVKARSQNTRLRFPFATMDIVSIVNSGSYLTNKKTDEDNNQGRLTYQAVKDVIIQVSVRGNNKVSYRLAEKLQFGFEFDDIREAINTTTGGVIADITGITTTPDVLNTSQQEINSFNITLRVIDTNERTVGLIERSNVDSTVRQPNGTPLPQS